MLKLWAMENDKTPAANVQNWPIVGHETVVRLLAETLTAVDRPSPDATTPTRQVNFGPRHAYLFTGSRHTGKTTIAQNYAKALLCLGNGSSDNALGESAGKPCNSCRSCRLVDSGNHPDLRMIQPTDKDGTANRSGGILRVEQAGDIIHEAALSPLEGRYKCFIIQDIHTANASFANKLLKTLEEPPAHVILLLTALDRSSLLPTIVSRCQLLELRPLRQALISQSLVSQWHVEPQKAELLARLSNGRMGWAIGQIDDEQAWQWRSEQIETLSQLIKSDRVSRLAHVESMASKGNQDDLVHILELWTLWWRDVMLAQSGSLDSCINIDLKNEIEKLAAIVTPAVVQKYLRALQQIENYLRHTTNLRLTLDVLLLQLPMAK